MPQNRVLDLAALRAFVAVADLRSFTHAAARLNLTQSAITMRIQRLEIAEGVQLLARPRRAMNLTPYGATLLVYARRMLALNDEARAALHGVQVVRLGAMEDYATRVLPPLLAEFARHAPNIAVDVQVGITSRMIGDLGEHHDVLLAMHRRGATSDGVHVHATRPLWAASLGFSAPDHRPLPLAIYAEGCPFRSWALEALDRAGHPWRIAYSSPSQTAVEAAAASGVGVTIARATTIAEGLHPLPGFPDLPEAEIRMHRSASTSEGVHLLADFLHDRLAA